jgi:hypothetical protein
MRWEGTYIPHTLYPTFPFVDITILERKING